MNGKGSKRRPLTVPETEFTENWDRIFAKRAKADFERALREEQDDRQTEIDDDD